MKYLKVAGASLNQTPLAFSSNQEHILQAIGQARDAGVSILCLPEMAISGYGCEDAFFYPETLRRSSESLAEICSACVGLTVSVGLPMEYEHGIFNVVALIHDTRLLGFVAKQDLPGDGIYYEPRWFKPWREGEIVDFEWQGECYPFGDIIFEVDGIRIGMEICEDAWNGERPAQRHYRYNVDVILNPSASNFALGKTAVRQSMVTEASRAFNCSYIYSNLLGNEAGRIIYDGEILIAQAGKLLARNRRFSYEEADILTAVLDVEAVHTFRRKSFNFRPQEAPHLVWGEGQYLSHPAPGDPVSLPETETPEEEFYLAETLALFDYMRKSFSRGFVISLSGGADSSTSAVLCAHALLRAERELGREGIRQRLAYAALDEKAPLVGQLLTCVYQSTANSGPETLESARQLAAGLGAEFHHWELEDIHQAYKKLAAAAVGRTLDWDRDDLTLQNIQARLRSPGIWMIANIRRALLITTSNRSEAAVGYATMDGDTSGGLAPLSGIDKDFILNWLRWAERELPVPSLSYVNGLTPTAELRPAERVQSDEADLMPYTILDEIEKCAIRDYQSPVEVFLRLRGRYPDAELKGYIRRFFELFTRNQWKRERYAPGFHLDDKNLDPKTWCRFPILNGGFREGLADLDEI